MSDLYGNPENFFTFQVDWGDLDGSVDTDSDPYTNRSIRCAPRDTPAAAEVNAGGRPLTTISVVPKTATTTAFGDAPTDVQVGQWVPLTVTVAPGTVGENVEIYDGDTKIGLAALDSKGVAGFAWGPRTPGEHSLSAKYLGNERIAGSESVVQTVVVSDAETTTVLTGPATAQTGTEVSFEAQVSPTPEGGTVQFRDGETDLGEPVAVDADGKAAITRTFDSEGTHDITAVYSGTAGHSGSTAPAVTITVTDEPTPTGPAGNTFGS
ncbi:Ig-like domain-containing protein [Rhodococcus marinonascens]|uniref:Ig-like domain-containing protein n=1 Tax=Rhodococcus marinonascens TaxID=38311 RepID=UPI0014739E0C|nr:Ig-like domain-containing protein [Rhodococcus marinonascens]